MLCYGDVAQLAGNHRASRAVGYAMAACPADVPAHRVLFKDGSLSSAFIQNGKNRQYTLLRSEGVKFSKGKKADMRKHSWRARQPDLAAFLQEGI